MAWSGPERREAVGAAFSLDAMMKAQALTFEAVRRIDLKARCTGIFLELLRPARADDGRGHVRLA